jgi:hypothetical protein
VVPPWCVAGAAQAEDASRLIERGKRSPTSTDGVDSRTARLKRSGPRSAASSEYTDTIIGAIASIAETSHACVFPATNALDAVGVSTSGLPVDATRGIFQQRYVKRHGIAATDTVPFTREA